MQSGYFSSMFSGSWKESNMMVIELEIPDQNIDTEGEPIPKQKVDFIFTFNYLFSWLFYSNQGTSGA